MVTLEEIKKLYFGYEDIARQLDITPAAARVSASRYQKSGRLIRLKRNMYVNDETWRHLTVEEKYRLANLIQTPSYISFATALEYFQISTQMQQNYFESMAVRRTKTVEIRKTVFSYHKLAPALYFGFRRVDGFFIASAEKAFLDAAYLSSLGLYNIDLAAIDFEKLNQSKLRIMLNRFPIKTKNWMQKYDCLPKT